MEPDELCFAPATELARLLRRCALSPVELLDALLARIERANPTVNALCTVAAEQARAAARAAEARFVAGDPLGPLAGLPVAIKDLTPTAGIRTTYGSQIFERHVPVEDAAVVARIRAAGGISSASEHPRIRLQGRQDNRLFGATRNPWNPAVTAGGSSGARRPRLPPGWSRWRRAATSPARSASPRRCAASSA